MRRINIILKATENCNMRCQYCYNCDSKYIKDVMPEERLERLFTLLAKEYDAINIVWHGGEPLLCGKSFFQRAVALEESIHQTIGATFENSIQTNATLIDNDWISFLQKYRFKLGVSFDGIQNEIYRQKTDEVYSSIKLLQKRKVSFGCLAVVADDNYDMLGNYKFFSKHGLSFALSPMFSEGGAEKLPALSPEHFSESVRELFDFWFDDVNGVNVRLFTDYIAMLFGSHTRSCTNGSCHGKWLGITPDGNLYNCGRDSMKQYCFGNIDEIDSVSQAFSSEGFRQLLVGAIERRKKCKETCELFPYCESGCSDCAMLENGLDSIPGFSCYCFKSLFPYIRERIQTAIDMRIPLSRLNPAVRTVIMKRLSENS